MYDAKNGSAIARANQLAADVLERPGYYTKIAAYAVGVVIALAIIRTIVTALDVVPVLTTEQIVEEA